MSEITLIKPYRQSETLRLYTETDIVELLRSDSYAELINDLRSYYPMLELRREADGSVSGSDLIANKLPRICFASKMENRNRQRVTLGDRKSVV